MNEVTGETQREHILVVEDDPSLSAWISDYLIDHNFRVSVASRGDIAVDLIQSDMPDLVLLDIMLPHKNGFDVCQEVRRFFPRPILMMTANIEEASEVQSLELGADDYLNKPLKPRVLLARINALLRRDANNTQVATRVFGSLSIDANTKSASLNGQPVAISSREFDVLWLLACQAGKVVNRTELVSRLRGFDYDGFDRSIDIRISRLRKKLQDNPEQPYRIKTVWGEGYLFAGDAW